MCEDIYQLRQKEEEYIRQKGTLNTKIAGKTMKECQTDEKECVNKKNQIYILLK